MRRAPTRSARRKLIAPRTFVGLDDDRCNFNGLAPELKFSVERNRSIDGGMRWPEARIGFERESVTFPDFAETLRQPVGVAKILGLVERKEAVRPANVRSVPVKPSAARKADKTPPDAAWPA